MVLSGQGVRSRKAGSGVADEAVVVKTAMETWKERRMVAETGGLILPQDIPIILLAEEFDKFEPIDQSASGHLVDKSQNALSLSLYPGSILIAGLVESNKGKLDMGVANKGVHLDFTE